MDIEKQEKSRLTQIGEREQEEETMYTLTVTTSVKIKYFGFVGYRHFVTHTL